MPLLLTMHVFSGVPDPTWVIGGDQEAELRRLVASQAGQAGVAPDTAGRLGYRGFTVTDTTADPSVPPLFTVEGASGQPQPSHSIFGKSEIEAFLLQSGHQSGHISDEINAHATSTLQSAIVTLSASPAANCPACHAVDAPVYNPAFWNTPTVQPHNNCYNYASNQATGTIAQPGRATGHMYAAFNCPQVRAGATSDGLVAVGNFRASLTSGHGWYVALAIWPGQDYHWYRQDKVGCWSHKPGSTAARNVDNAGLAITDPRSANRGPYTVFCTFMITKRTVHIR